MKRLLFMLLLVSFAVGASAQWKVARVKQKFVYEPKEGYSLERGEIVGFSENRNGTITIFCEGGECTVYDAGPFSNSVKNKYLEYIGYYLGQIRDPLDDYVNVRKGPGTNYPVVGKLSVLDWIYFQKTESNWLKVYVVHPWAGDNGFFYTFGCIGEEPSDCIFVGYI